VKSLTELLGPEFSYVSILHSRVTCALGLKLRFGSEGLQLLPAIQAITEANELETLCDALVLC
jgi:hypothetical protein